MTLKELLTKGKDICPEVKYVTARKSGPEYIIDYYSAKPKWSPMYKWLPDNLVGEFYLKDLETSGGKDYENWVEGDDN